VTRGRNVLGRTPTSSCRASSPCDRASADTLQDVCGVIGIVGRYSRTRTRSAEARELGRGEDRVLGSCSVGGWCVRFRVVSPGCDLGDALRQHFAGLRFFFFPIPTGGLTITK